MRICDSKVGHEVYSMELAGVVAMLKNLPKLEILTPPTAYTTVHSIGDPLHGRE